MLSYLRSILLYEKRLKIPALKNHHKLAREKWAKTMLSNRDGWGNIIFSDEKKFKLDGPDGPQFYWHDLSLEKETFCSQNHEAGSVMIWGRISSEGLTELAFLDGRQSSADYIKVLEDHLLPFGETYYGKNFIFLQDNTLIHTSKLTKTTFPKQKFQSCELASLFPDLNPIENVWGMLSRLVYNNKKQFHSKSDLENAFRSVWKELDGKIVKKLNKING